MSCHSVAELYTTGRAKPKFSNFIQKIALDTKPAFLRQIFKEAPLISFKRGKSHENEPLKRSMTASTLQKSQPFRSRVGLSFLANSHLNLNFRPHCRTFDGLSSLAHAILSNSRGLARTREGWTQLELTNAKL